MVCIISDDHHVFPTPNLPLIQAVHDEDVLKSPWGEQLVVAAPLAYVCACAFFSLFKLGSLGPYHMVPGSTWSWSLLLNASLLSRFAAPLCFNFLHVIRMTGGQRGGRRLVFAGLMKMEDVPLLGAGFNTWFPLVMVLYVGVLTTGFCEDCAAKLLTPARLRFDSERADDEHTERGQRLVLAEHEALAGGGSLGEGTQLFGMAAAGAGTSARRSGGGGGGSLLGSSPADAGELQMGGGMRRDGGGSSSYSTVRQPLFGSTQRSDAPSSGAGEPSSRPSWRSQDAATPPPQAPDTADRLFAQVGGRR